MTAERGGFSPEYQAMITEFSQRARGLEVKYGSENSALAHVLLEEGRNRLLEATFKQDTHSLVQTAPDPNALFNDLPDKIRIKALEGLGFIMLGSFVTEAVNVKKTGANWDNRAYISLFNEGVRGTPIPGISDDLIKTLPVPTPQSETAKILAIYSKDIKGNMSPFFQMTTNLPAVVQIHLSTYRSGLGEKIFQSAVNVFINVRQEMGNSSKLLPIIDTRSIDPKQRDFLMKTAHLSGAESDLDPEKILFEVDQFFHRP